MAEIYRAKPFNTPAFDRFLAVKRILPNLAEDAEFISMFLDEAKIAIQLNHPNICQNYELGKIGRTPYIVMEYIAGQNLLAIHKRLRKQRKVIHYIPAAFIAREVALALDHAHSLTDELGRPMGLVHRDVSPQNILISFAGEVKLIDFGIAKVRSSSHTTQVGVLKGKFGYMSPEQVESIPIDGRSDLFALGTVVHEMLTGKRLFHGKTDFDTLENVRRAQIKPPSVYNDKIPDPLVQIVMRALARDREERYQNGSQMADDLTQFLNRNEREFTSNQLSDWMMHYFDQELKEERKHRELFRQFVSPEDVYHYNAQLLDEIRRSMGAPEEDIGEPLLEDEEITQVVATDYDRLMADLGSPAFPDDQVEEVIAENLYEPLPSLIARHRESVLANVDLPEPHEPEPIWELFEPYHKRSRRWVWLIPLVLLLGTGVGLGWMHFRGEVNPGRRPSTGTISLRVLPATDLQVFVSGRMVSDRAPVFVRDLTPGEHAVEIRHPDYLTYQGRIQVESGRVSDLDVELDPLPEGAGWVSLTVDPPQAEIWIDGELARFESGQEQRVALSSREPHRIEIRQDGYFVTEREVTLRTGEERAFEFQLAPVNATLFVQSHPAGRAYLDRVALGDTRNGISVTSLNPYRPHLLHIEPSQPGYQVYETTVLFETVLEKNLFVTLDYLGETSGSEEIEYGYLAIRSMPRWYRVLLDGADTGLTTPIAQDEAPALRVGTRLIELFRGEERIGIPVTIEAHHLTIIDCGDPMWNCGQR